MSNIRYRQGRALRATILAIVAITGSRGVDAQAPARPPATSYVPSGALAPPPPYRSVEQLADSRVTFRLCAPDATTVSVTSSDADPAIPMGEGGGPAGLLMTKDAMGLWSATTTVPVAAGTYRFNFRCMLRWIRSERRTAHSMSR